ncbi:MAG: response regulator [Bacteroidota bacterium]
MSEEHGLPYLRDKLFISVLLITFPICILAYVPSVVVSFITHQPILVFFDTLAMLVLAFVFFGRNLKIRLKKKVFSAIFYILAIVLFYYLGLKGPSVVMLYCTSVLITLFQSKRAGLIAVSFNAAIFLTLLMVSPVRSGTVFFFQEFPVGAWLAIGVNLIAFNALIVLSVASLVDHLNESLLEEMKLQELLKREGMDLVASKLKAEESDRLKTAFLANMSHEIRTPMNGILGFSSFLSDPDLTPGDQQKYLSIIKKSSARMLNIINEIIEISRIESGQMDVSRRETNINEQTEDVYTLLKPEVDQEKIVFSFQNGLSSHESCIQTDGEKLVAILTNLVKNSIKYTEKGSITFGYHLRPAVSTTQISRPAELEFFVKDTGIGIPSDRQNAIFDRFVQADIADVQARQGAGLGLSIAKSYVEMLQGRIWVNSEVDRGSTFYFTLPYTGNSGVKSGKKNIEMPDIQEFPVKGLNVLIVEDDEVSRIFLKTIVRKISRNIIYAQSGAEAISLCRNNPDIDLILMDVRMPEMTGHDTTREIRRFNKDVIIIAQTAHALKGDRETALEAGCNDYITKPILKNQLMEMIHRQFVDAGILEN